MKRFTIPPTVRVFFLIVLAAAFSTLIAMPAQVPIKYEGFGRKIDVTITRPNLAIPFFGRQIRPNLELKQGLDIQGGMQMVLRAKMDEIPADRRDQALASAQEILRRRVDLYGVSEPTVQTARQGDEYRIIVELAGVKDPDQALQLIGTTAQLDFRLQDASAAADPAATQSALAFFNQFKPTGLTGKQLQTASVVFADKTNEPQVSLVFNPEGAKLFGKITQENIGGTLAIFLDNFPLMFPTIKEPILTGQAVLSGSMTVEQARQLAIQLNAGALPVPIEIIEQRTIGASLGQQSVQDSIRAGLIGLGFVILFMIIYYGWKGVLASMSLLMYAVFTIAAYKLFGVTLTLPGIAGLLLSIGMAVDSNILIFERMKEELRMGKPFNTAMELGFGRAWDSIKDANIATITTAIILINPLDFPFLNSSGLVRGFGVTLLIGVLISLFTGMVVTRTLMRLFLKGK